MTDSNRTEFPSNAPVTSRPIADVQAPQVGEGNQVTYTYPIRQPEEDLNDFQVGVRASLLNRCQARLQTIACQGFPVPELLLGLSTLAAGGSLSAIVAQVTLASWRGVVFFIMLPIIAVGAGVAYGMLRHSKLRATQQLAQDMLDDLPDPARAVEVRSQ